ncbi:MAG TPA: ribonuclease H-like domain-containing protein [Candidatus Paceibacterota bacterium]|nr:ribonuclease H-like domain-containing protein [Candidatus Paceibacterota bacterium]HMP18791.1 ribonuclease H-like domain-containing protein [Candidatus Paceibacterota bacterium]
MNYLVFDIETTDIILDDPMNLEIAVVSVYEKNNNSIKSFLKDQLHQMWPIFERVDFVVGYNSDHFDIPLLNKYYQGNLNSIKSIDILKYIKESFGKRVKLESVANGTLGYGKITSGIQAVEWWKQGKIDDVIKYCEQDVLITKDIFEYILENKKVKFKDLISEKIIEVPINTSDWNKKEENSITKSLF